MCQNQTYTYAYDLRGNRIAETGKKESREYVYDETNRLVEGTNWKGDKSAYTYNGLGVRINNTHTTHSGSVYDRDYVIDYTSLERDDLMVYAEGNGQLEYVQREVYAGSERIEQFTDRSRGGYERLLYVHEDLQGNTRYYTKATGQSFAELTYDAWGMPESPNKLLNNDHGNYVYATYTGHIFDTTLDIYFCEARFYDASTRTWMAMDPVKDGGNWYQYCCSSPVVYFDPDGESAIEIIVGLATKFAVGAVGSAAASIVMQAVDLNKGTISLSNVNWKNVAVDALTGGISSILPFGTAAKTVINMALGAGGQVIKNVWNNKSWTKDTLVSGVSAGLGTIFSSFIPINAFPVSSSPGPQFSNPLKSLGDAVMNVFSSYPIERYIARYALDITLPYFFVETFTGGVLGGLTAKIWETISEQELKKRKIREMLGCHFILASGCDG